MAGAGGSAVSGADGTLIVSGLVAAQVGDLAFEHLVRLHELTVVRASLEAAFMELTADSVEYRAAENEPGQPPEPELAAQGRSAQGQSAQGQSAQGQSAQGQSVREQYSHEGQI